ncbi:hypothetical protein [Aeromonas media]|uniref:hypothetical protein n=1 Tax=Aeromonas media TaxID=651 RepID=UPI001396AD5E|nr:hypothetical protein [Aeromonas media]
MQIKRFIATDVHDYLNFDAVFRPDVNFIAGLNGTGKTTALIIIMSLLTPDIKNVNEHKVYHSQITSRKRQENIRHTM